MGLIGLLIRRLVIAIRRINVRRNQELWDLILQEIHSFNEKLSWRMFHWEGIQLLSLREGYLWGLLGKKEISMICLVDELFYSFKLLQIDLMNVFSIIQSVWQNLFFTLIQKDTNAG